VDGSALNHIPAIRREILAMDPNLPLINVRTMDAVMDERMSRQRFSTSLLAMWGRGGGWLTSVRNAVLEPYGSTLLGPSPATPSTFCDVFVTFGADR
jgi:hypothetical protein